MGFIYDLMKQDSDPFIGEGYRVYDVTLPGNRERELIVYEKPALMAQIRSSLDYIRVSGGDLPDNDFWNTTVTLFRADKGFFNQTHDCDILHYLLVLNDRYDQHNRPVPVIPPAPPLDSCRTCSPVPPTPEPPVPAVPEPVSILSLGVGLVGAYLGGRHWQSRRKAAR